MPPPRIWGLTHGGGPREAFQPTDYDFEDANFLGRMVFDLFFWVLIAVIIMNLVLGIIVDTFSQLRSERERNLDEISNYCFICGLPAFSFHEASGGFHNHHRREHNMWDYVYYRSALAPIPLYWLRCLLQSPYEFAPSLSLCSPIQTHFNVHFRLLASFCMNARTHTHTPISQLFPGQLRLQQHVSTVDSLGEEADAYACPEFGRLNPPA